MSGACDTCLRRAWLLANLGPVLDRFARDRARFYELLALGDAELIEAAGGRRRASLRSDYGNLPDDWLDDRERAHTTCRHLARHPDALRSQSAPGPVYIAGDAERLRTLSERPRVALLGSRRASEYAIDVARALARGLTACGATVVSLLGGAIGRAAQHGALEASGESIALAGDGLLVTARGRSGALQRLVARRGCVIAELPDSVDGRLWGLVACERCAVELASVAVIVEAEETDADLGAARLAFARGRDVAAVPGHVTSPLAQGAHLLLREGAHMVTRAEDVLELLSLPRDLATEAGAAGAPVSATLEPRLGRVLEHVSAGRDTADAVISACATSMPETLLALSELELMGLLRKAGGGRYLATSPGPSDGQRRSSISGRSGRSLRR